MRHFSLIVPLFLLTGLAVSCAKVESQSSAQSLKISVDSEEMLDTKATLYNNTSGISTIGISGYLGDDALLDNSATKGTTYWETQNIYYLSKPKTLSMFAYYPSDLSISATKTALSLSSYTVPAKAADQKDIMAGYVSKSLSSSDMTASVELNHAMTSVAFKYGEVPAEKFSVTGITISGVYASGKCSVSTAGAFTWSNQTTGGSFTGTTSVTPAKDAGLGAGATFALIPQANFKPSIKVNYTYDSVAKSVTYTPDANISWERGNTYTYLINFNAAKVTLTVTAVDFNGGSWYTHDADNANAGKLNGENW